MLRFIVVTPTFNSADYIGDTLKSVLGQSGDYILHYHVQDGQSKDATVGIVDEAITPFQTAAHYGEVRTYASWTSERDAGMYDGINRGFEAVLSNGAFDDHETILTWINSDDMLQWGALAAVADIFRTLPDVDLLTGRLGIVDENGSITHVNEIPEIAQPLLAAGLYDSRNLGLINQEGTFWRLGLWRAAGGVDNRLKVAGDWDLWRRLGARASMACADSIFALHRRRAGQLSADMDRYLREIDGALGKDDHAERKLTLERYGALLQVRDLYRLSQFAATRIHYNHDSKVWERSGQSVLPLLPSELRAGGRSLVGQALTVVSGASPATGPFPEWNLPAGIRWVQGAALRGTIDRDYGATGRLRATLRIYASGLHCHILLNGERIASVQLTPYGNDREVELAETVTLVSGRNHVELRFDGVEETSYSVLLLGCAFWPEVALDDDAALSVGPPSTIEAPRPDAEADAFAAEWEILVCAAGEEALTSLRTNIVDALGPAVPLLPCDLAAASDPLAAIGAALAGRRAATRFIRIVADPARLERFDAGLAVPTAKDTMLVLHPVRVRGDGRRQVATRRGNPVQALAGLDEADRVARLLAMPDVGWRPDLLTQMLNGVLPAERPATAWSPAAPVLIGADAIVEPATAIRRLCIVAVTRGSIFGQGSFAALLAEATLGFAEEVNVVNLVKLSDPDGALDEAKARELIRELDLEGYDLLIFASDGHQPDGMAERVMADAETPTAIAVMASSDPRDNRVELRPLARLPSAGGPAVAAVTAALDDNLIALMPARGHIRDLLGLAGDEAVLLIDPQFAGEADARRLNELVKAFRDANSAFRPHLVISPGKSNAAWSIDGRTTHASLFNRIDRLSWLIASDGFVTRFPQRSRKDPRGRKSMLHLVAAALGVPVIDISDGKAVSKIGAALAAWSPDGSATRGIAAARARAAVGLARMELSAAVAALAGAEGSILVAANPDPVTTAEIYDPVEGGRTTEPSSWAFRPGPGLRRVDEGELRGWMLGRFGGAVVVRPPATGARRLRFALLTAGSERIETLTFLVDGVLLDQRRLRIGDRPATINIDIDHSFDRDLTVLVRRRKDGEADVPGEDDQLLIIHVAPLTYNVVGRLSSMTGTRAASIMRGLPGDGSYHVVSGGSFSMAEPGEDGQTSFAVRGVTARLRVFSSLEGQRITVFDIKCFVAGELTVSIYGQVLLERELEVSGGAVDRIEVVPFFHIGYNDLELSFAPARGEGADEFADGARLYDVLAVRLEEQARSRLGNDEAVLVAAAEDAPARIDWDKSLNISNPHPASEINNLKAGFRWMEGTEALLVVHSRATMLRLMLTYRSAIADQRLRISVKDQPLLDDVLPLTTLRRPGFVEFEAPVKRGVCRLRLETSATVESADGKVRLSLLIEDIKIVEV